MFRQTRSHADRMQWQVVLPFLGFLAHAWVFRSWLVDDAGITFAYARNFVHGQGLVAQAGAAPVEGFSNPLWTLMLSPLFVREPVDPTALVKTVSIALVLATFFAVGRLVSELFEERSWARLVTAVALALLATNTSYVVWSTSGLENALYGLLAVLLCLLCTVYARRAGEPDSDTSRIALLAGLISAGLALTRPDGVVYAVCFPIVWALVLRAAPRPRSVELRNAAAFAVAASLPTATYIAFRLAYFGDLFPNTYRAKGGPRLGDAIRLALFSKMYVNKAYELTAGMFSLLAGWVVVLVVAAGVLVVARSPRRLAFAPLLVSTLCALAGYCLLPRDWMGEFRFATPFFVLFYALAAALMAEAAALAVPLAPPRRVAAFAVAMLALASVSAKVYLPRTRAFAHKPTVPFGDVARSCGERFNFYADALAISDASILLPDLGGTLYFSRHRIVDLAGLCDPSIAWAIRAGDGGALRDYVFETVRPTFIHVHDDWSVRWGFFSDERFRAEYVPISEEPSEYARAQGRPECLTGDYIRRDAVSSPGEVERLRALLDEHGRPLHEPPPEMWTPFPRG